MTKLFRSISHIGFHLAVIALFVSLAIQSWGGVSADDHPAFVRTALLLIAVLLSEISTSLGERK